MTIPARETTTSPARTVALLPAPPLGRRVVLAAIIGCSIVYGAGRLMQSSLGTASPQPLIAVAVFAGMMAIAIGLMRDDHPFPRFGPANHVTMVRAMLVALAASSIGEPAGSAVAWMIAVVTAIVAALDGVDGWLARRTRMSSTFGARFDMETDAFFMLVLSLIVWRHQKAGAWVMAIGLMRYAFVLGGWIMPWLARPLRSTLRGKAAAVVQFAALGVAMIPLVPASLSSVVVGAALATLLWSFAIDVRYLWRLRG